MRLMLVTGSFPPMRCGVGDYGERLTRALAQSIDVHVLTSPEGVGGGTPRAGVSTRCLGGWQVRRMWRFMHMLREISPDVVHIQYPTQGYAGAWLPELIPLIARILGARVVQTWHEPIRMRHLPRLALRLLSLPTVIVVRPDFIEKSDPSVRAILRRCVFHHITGGPSLPTATLSSSQRRLVRSRLLCGQQRLVVFFGFVYPAKGVDLLFDIADPATDHLVIAGERPDAAYQELLDAKAGGDWAGKVSYAGYLPGPEIAEMLAVSDAVVLPFRDGAGEWNSSLHGAQANGAYVVATSRSRRGYDAATNVAYVAVDDVVAMREALALSVERPGRPGLSNAVGQWEDIAAQHLDIYCAGEPNTTRQTG